MRQQRCFYQIYPLPYPSRQSFPSGSTPKRSLFAQLKRIACTDSACACIARVKATLLGIIGGMLLQSCITHTGMNFDEGHQWLRSTLLGAIRAAEAEQRIRDYKERSPAECNVGRFPQPGTYKARQYYNIQVPSDEESLRVLDRIDAYWTQQGHSVNRARLTDAQPEIVVVTDGFRFRAVPGSGIVNLAGETPCLKGSKTQEQTE